MPHIEVGKPHITLVRSPKGVPLPRFRYRVWVCSGAFGSYQYGASPADAYGAWARALARRVFPARR